MRDQRCKLDLQKFDGQEMIALSQMLILLQNQFSRKGYKFWIKVKKPSKTIAKNPTPVKI